MSHMDCDHCRLGREEDELEHGFNTLGLLACLITIILISGVVFVL